MRAVSKVTLMRWHLWIGIIVVLPLLAWSLSGVLHPIMSRIKPTVMHHTAPPLQLTQDQLRALPKTILQQHGITSVSRISLVQFQGNTWYRVQLHAEQTTDNVLYIHTKTGEILEQGEQIYAQWLARYYSGEQQAKITSVSLVHHFSPEYPSINRLLPVWRVQFERDDGLRAFIDTSSSGLGKLVDTKTYLFKQFFFWFHDWSFLQDLESLRIILLSVLCLLSLVGGITGLWLYSGLYHKLHRPRNSMQKMKQYHRVMGLVFSVGLLMFSASGVLHALSKFEPDTRHLVMDKQRFALQTIQPSFPKILETAVQAKTIQSINFHTVAQQPVLHLQVAKEHGQQSLYIDPNTGELLPQYDESYAKALAVSFSGISEQYITSVEHITHYTNEYGFINKRLPVWKVSFNAPNHPYYFVHTASGHLAAKYDDITALESSSFSNLHKFGVLDALGRDTRDSIMAINAFALIVVSFLGVYVYLKRRKKRLV
jgi:uncharacterized iron-regulated membrane protein